MSSHKHRGARLPHLGGKGSTEEIGAKGDSSLICLSSLFDIHKVVTLFGDFNLCVRRNPVVPPISPSSAYLLNISAVRVAADTLTSVYNLIPVQNPSPVASPASTYGLSTAPT